jgi:hypothetical protein
MSTFFTLADLKTTPLKNTPVNFVKVYVKEKNLKYLNAAGEELDVVLDRPLENFTLPGTASPVTSSDTIATALGKIQATLDSATGLGGTNYVYVAANGTDVENAAELQAAYTKAATLVNSVSNYISFNIFGAMDYGSGSYEVYFNPSNTYFSASTTYTLKINNVVYTGTTQFAASSSVFFTTNAPAGLSITSFEVLDVKVERATVIAAPGFYNFGSNAFQINTEFVDLYSLDGERSIIFTGGTNNQPAINVTAHDVTIKGVNVEGKTIIAESNQGKNTFINCKSLGNESFGFVNSTGKFIDCEGGAFAFGANNDASGTYINCTAGIQSFGNVYNASGTFINCTASDSSFGYTASGVFIDCTGSRNCFGSSGTASGTFENCKANDESFGGGFGMGTASGKFVNCESGNSSFGGGVLTGKLYYCRLTSGTFKTVTGTGRTYYSIDGNGTPNNQ